MMIHQLVNFQEKLLSSRIYDLHIAENAVTPTQLILPHRYGMGWRFYLDDTFNQEDLERNCSAKH